VDVLYGFLSVDNTYFNIWSLLLQYLACTLMRQHYYKLMCGLLMCRCGICHVVYMQGVPWRFSALRLRLKLIVMISLCVQMMISQVLVCLLFLCVLYLLWCFCPHALLINISDKSYLWNICLSVHLSISQRLRPCRWRCWTCLLRLTRLITASCYYCVISVHHMTSAVRPYLDQLSNASGILVCRRRPYVYKRNRIQFNC